MSGVELWTLMGSDEDIEDVIALLRLGLGVAEEAEMVHPETVSALRMWCNVENKRIHPPEPVKYMTREQEVKASLKRSPHWRFWESLAKDQEVRWTGTKNATYFVVDPELSYGDPSNERGVGLYIELRRHSGKTFWSHIAKVRPL